ncbi:hypothetical protein AU252_20420 [Pseudarthrobacter sulfonivorans]|uniref:Uncharacterized protein n=1 Tax=Pseudarthrobacter sulfonivorans TaxID=121292 RepID=A0A0U3RDC2_9MICC|nr:hypothetical protein AU252_20420 [Pseudarthrobacter sulfonivorans]
MLPTGRGLLFGLRRFRAATALVAEFAAVAPKDGVHDAEFGEALGDLGLLVDAAEAVGKGCAGLEEVMPVEPFVAGSAYGDDLADDVVPDRDEVWVFAGLDFAGDCWAQGGRRIPDRRLRVNRDR